MLCSKCGAENPPASNFCQECGASLAPPPSPPQALAVTCPKCGAENPPASNFCQGCGASLAPAPVPPPVVAPPGLAGHRPRSVPIFILCGAVGFALGGAIAFGIGTWFWNPFLHSGIMGAIGGAVLGLASRGWGRALVLALAGAIGFGVSSAILDIRGYGGIMASGITGAVGGASLGIVSSGWKGLVLPALASAIGFGAARAASEAFFQAHIWPGGTVWWVVYFTIYGIIGGALLGLALGSLAKRASGKSRS